MTRDWDRDVAVFAARENLTEAQTDAVQRFVRAMMRLDSVEVSVDSVTWSEATTQGLSTAATEHDTEEAEIPVPTAPEQRYLDLGRIGIGGMGEVRKVRDTVLNRFVAMKILRKEHAEQRAAVLRFVAEAQATAQLQHPGMVPVHDIGQLPDGRWFFTMKQLQGDTFQEVLRAYRSAHYARGLRGMVEILASVCDAVAFAHAGGAIHRDLKPANILVGAFNEVVVLDWGLVKARGTPTGAPGLVTDLGSIGTKLGTVIGTPAYMPPEQARGQHDAVGPATDVYAIGAMLYELLCGRRPYLGSVTDVLEQIVSGDPAPLPATVPAGLAAICTRAMARRAKDRFPDGAALGTALRDWLDGAARRERALALLQQADALQPVVEGALTRSEELTQRAEEWLAPIPSWAPSDDKQGGWRLQEQAEQERIRADLVGLQRLQLLRSALTEVPEMPEAQERLAYVYHFCHARAVRLGDAREAAQYEALLRAHDRGTYAAYLDGEGSLRLRTRPAGMQARLLRFEPEHRRLVTRPIRSLPATPIERLPLAHGSWLIELSGEGRAPTRYPVYLERGEAWTGIAPGGRAPAPIPIPLADELGPDDCYVPAGWCRLGETPTQQAWVEGFVIKRFPVTNAEYKAFLDDLVRRGEAALAAQVQPTAEGSPCFARADDGTFLLEHPATGRAWQPRWPVVYVDLDGARAYATWYAARSGRAWRLPWEAEWEKAARGVDGRRYVMGDFLDPSWAEIRGSTPTEEVHPVDAFPLDESVYGVRGLTGGVADWCLDRYRGARVPVRAGRVEPYAAGAGDRAVCRGGIRTVPESVCVASFRHAVPTDKRSVRVGFRLARPFELELDRDSADVWILSPP